MARVHARYNHEGTGEGREGGGDSRLLIAIMHHFRDGAPLLLLVETPPTFGRSLCFSHIANRTVCLSYRRPVSLSAAIIYLLGYSDRYLATLESTKPFHVTYVQFPHLLL